MITKRQMCIKTITGTSNAGAGTRSSHAHALPWIPNINDITLTAKAANDDAANCASMAIVSVDATNIVVKSTAASTAFVAKIWANRETGEINLND